MLYLGFSAYAFLNSKDDVLKDDSDLRLANVVVPVSENAYFDLAEIDKNYTEKTVSEGVYDAETDTTSASVTEKVFNDKALELFKSASTRLKYQNPAWANHDKVDSFSEVGNVASIREMADQLIAESKTLAAAGKIDEAIEKDLVVVRVGQLVNSTEDNLITWLVGVAIESKGLKEITHIKPDYKLSADLAKGSSKDGITRSLKSEYMTMNNSLSTGDLLSEWGLTYEVNDGTQTATANPLLKFLNKNYILKINQTSNLMADKYRMLIRNAQAVCGSQLEKPVMFSKQPDEYFDSYFYILLVENGLGKTMADVSYESLQSVIEKQCNLEALRNKLR